MALERAGSDVEIECADGRARGYLSVPATGHGRGVLVLMDPGDSADFAVDVSDRLGREGFVALSATLGNGTDPEATAPLLEAAIAELLNQHATDGARVAAVGFGSGGLCALLAGLRSERVGAIATFHTAPSDSEWSALGAEELRPPVLAFFGSKEDAVASGAADALAKRIEALRGRVRVLSMATAGAAFMDAARPDGYDATAAVTSWDELLAFLRAEL